MTPSATHNGAVRLRAKAIDAAAALMQARPDALEIVDGKVLRKAEPAGPSISLGEIAEHLAPTSKTLGDRERGLSAEGWFRVKHQVYPYGIHFAVVKVDRATGGVKVEDYVIAYDIGRAINPALVKGQIVGGFAQGLGGALLEEFTYNERGDPLATTFADYLMPTARETPEVHVILREDYTSPLNPLGIKGAGESGITGVGAAIASAIDDAIGIPGAVTQLPVTPQRLKQILDARREVVGGGKEIGRAAWRGRGEISVGGVSLKKKKRLVRARLTIHNTILTKVNPNCNRSQPTSTARSYATAEPPQLQRWCALSASRRSCLRPTPV